MYVLLFTVFAVSDSAGEAVSSDDVFVTAQATIRFADPVSFPVSVGATPARALRKYSVPPLFVAN